MRKVDKTRASEAPTFEDVAGLRKFVRGGIQALGTAIAVVGLAAAAGVAYLALELDRKKGGGRTPFIISGG